MKNSRETILLFDDYSTLIKILSFGYLRNIIDNTFDKMRGVNLKSNSVLPLD